MFILKMQSFYLFSAGMVTHDPTLIDDSMHRIVLGGEQSPAGVQAHQA